MQRSGNILQDNVVVLEDGKRKEKISIAVRLTPLESREQLSPACHRREHAKGKVAWAEHPKTYTSREPLGTHQEVQDVHGSGLDT